MKKYGKVGRVPADPYFLAEAPPNQIQAKFGPNWGDFFDMVH